MNDYDKYIKYTSKINLLSNNLIGGNRRLNLLNNIGGVYSDINGKIRKLERDDRGTRNLIDKYSLSEEESKKNKTIPEEMIELEFYNYITGQGAGYAVDIAKEISKYYDDNSKLGVRPKSRLTINKFNYKIIPYNKHNMPPLFASGTYTAIYILENIRDITDKTKYILRIYDRDTDQDEDIHLLKTRKINNEYNLFNKYLINIYQYGTVTINGIRYDYIITQVYNTVEYASEEEGEEDYTITNLTNLEKTKILYNNVIMLNDLYNQNMFHADYKIDNIGWDDNYNIILIDYDYATIQEASEDNPLFQLDDKERVEAYNFPTTYVPNYIGRIKHGLPVYKKKPKYYKKFSVGGLASLIDALEIRPNTIKYPLSNDQRQSSVIKIPTDLITPENIEKIYISNVKTDLFPKSLYLTTDEYSVIPTYDDILKILKYLVDQEFIEDVNIGYI